MKKKNKSKRDQRLHVPHCRGQICIIVIIIINVHNIPIVRNVLSLIKWSDLIKEL